jgi:hypothetical protein
MYAPPAKERGRAAEGSMGISDYRFVKPPVSLWMYWPEGAFLVASVAAPIVAWAIWRNGAMVSRFGAVGLVFAAIAEFYMLNRMNKKHLLNAWRAKTNEDPWDFSRAANIIGYLALFAGVLNTILWGFGDLLLGT